MIDTVIAKASASGLLVGTSIGFDADTVRDWFAKGGAVVRSRRYGRPHQRGDRGGRAGGAGPRVVAPGGRVMTAQDPFIHAYTDRLSVPQGGEIGFCVSTDLPFYGVEIARIGARRQVVWTRWGLPGREHPVPADASERGCGWPVSFAVPVADDWPSGYYSALLRGEDEAGFGVGGEAAFVVRSAHPGRDAAILLQRPTNTEAAYNSLAAPPSTTARRGLRAGSPSSGLSPGFPGKERFLFTVSVEFAADLDRGVVPEALADSLAAGGVQVSPWASVHVERPGERWHILDVGFLSTLENLEDELAVHDGFSTWLSCWHHWERHFVAWAEAAGTPIDYGVNGDLESTPGLLEGYRLVLSVGPDEYLVGADAGQPGGVRRRRRQRRLLQRNVSWWQVRSEEKAAPWSAGRTRWKGIPTSPPATTPPCRPLVPPPDRPPGEPPHRGRLRLRRVPRLLFRHPADRGLHRPPARPLDVRRDRAQTGGPARGEGPDRQLRVRRLRVRTGRRPPVPTGRDGTPDTFEILATAPLP